ncbi:3'-5' exonuclease [Pseudalkalibacillus caeni]|uniref:3'-5' exonuclease n=1 Tax=Exobacillus caeni TaxID=2574798 RepID=A0A5R9F7S5_9BACL|nr:exonuclease domain-containing protein [Pseudalkalibacillus caeni]TLS35805.1 3'-5' exonuclease [Pseudalkalibacillus caeni]
MFWKKKQFQVDLQDDIPLNTPIDDLTYIVLDTETTGLALQSGDRLIELAGVKIQSLNVQEEQTFHTYINPNRKIPEQIKQLTGITDHNVTGAPNSADAIKAFFQYVEDSHAVSLVGHYVSFDNLVFKKELQLEGYRFSPPTTLDTLELLSFLYPAKQIKDLEEYAIDFGTRIYDRHTALGDCMTTAYLFCELVYRLKEKGLGTWGDLLKAGEINKRI